MRDRTVARNALLVTAFFILSRLLGVLREVLAARIFANQPEMGAYRAAFRLPDTLYLLVVGGALGAALIPVLATHLARGDRRAAWRLANGVLNGALLTLAVLGALAWLLAPWLVPALIVPGFAPELQALTVQLTRWLLLSPLILGISGLAMALLNAHERFLATSLAPVAYNLGILGGLLWLVPRWGIYGLVAGVLIGAGLHLGVQLPALLALGWRYAPVLDPRAEDLRQVGRLLLPRLLGQAAFQLNFVAMTNLASRLGPAPVSALGYAYQLLMLPHGVLAISLSTAAFPTLARRAAAGEGEAFRRLLGRSLRGLALLAVPAAVGLGLLARPLVQLLFQRGAFSAADTVLTASLLVPFAAGLAGSALGEVVIRAFYALQDTRTPVLWGTAAVALNLLLGWLWLPSLGAPGLALAFSTAVTAETAVLWGILRRRLGEAPSLWPALLRAAAASLPMAFLLVLWPPVGTSTVRLGLSVALRIAVGAGVYLLALLPLGGAGLLREALRRRTPSAL